jgi:hypothetical protein
MAMVNMQMSAEEAKEQTEPTAADAPKYPYGLELRLDDDALAKLGLTQPPAVGTKLTIHCAVEVTSASSYQTQGQEAEASSCWQITDMEIRPAASTSANAAGLLYPG